MGGGRVLARLLWLLLAVLVAFVGVTVFQVSGNMTSVPYRLQLWVLVALTLIIFLGAASYFVNGRYDGVLVDSRNKISLSRLQIVLWTILVLSAFVTIAVPRIVSLALDQNHLLGWEALKIRVPQELLWLMGISAASFAGSSLIKSSKQNSQYSIEQKLSPESVEAQRDERKTAATEAEGRLLTLAQGVVTAKQTLDGWLAAVAQAQQANSPAVSQIQALHLAQVSWQDAVGKRDEAKKQFDDATRALEAAEALLKAATDAQGRLHKNREASEARWSDLIRGEEVGNYRQVDVSKVQMLLFTIVVIATYAASLTGKFYESNLPFVMDVKLPELSETMVTLIGFSHATYLTVKSIDK